MRLIDADALIVDDVTCASTSCRYCKMQVNGCQDFLDIITNAFTIEPERKKGRWTHLDFCANAGYYCSECQKKLVKEGWSETVKKIKFCPNCGADMRGE